MSCCLATTLSFSPISFFFFPPPSLPTTHLSALTGDFRGTEIYLYFNAMTSLDPSVFKPLLTTATVTITDSNSIDIFTFIHFIHFIHFNLDGYFDSDPIVCDCNLAWIIRDNPQLLDQLTAFCTDTDGSRINVHFLDPNRFKNC